MDIVCRMRRFVNTENCELFWSLFECQNDTCLAFSAGFQLNNDDEGKNHLRSFVIILKEVTECRLAGFPNVTV
jgi:hypothetical protein